MNELSDAQQAASAERIGIRERLRRARIRTIIHVTGDQSRGEREMLHAAATPAKGLVSDVDDDRTIRIDHVLNAMRTALNSVLDAERERARMLEQFIGRIDVLLRKEGETHMGRDLSGRGEDADCDVGGRVIGSSERQAAPGNTAVQAMAVHRLARCLSPTELQVCLLLARNKSTKQIADMLSTAASTIESHRRSIRRKLGLEPRANLVSFLVAEMGLPFVSSAP